MPSAAKDRRTVDCTKGLETLDLPVQPYPRIGVSCQLKTSWPITRDAVALLKPRNKVHEI